MLIPKASHLVERVAERLLRSGALEDPQRNSCVSPVLNPPAMLRFRRHSGGACARGGAGSAILVIAAPALPTKAVPPVVAPPLVPVFP